jgi:hypothetical protein
MKTLTRYKIKAPATQDLVLGPQQLQLQFQEARSDKAFAGIPVTSIMERSGTHHAAAKAKQKRLLPRVAHASSALPHTSSN